MQFIFEIRKLFFFRYKIKKQKLDIFDIFQTFQDTWKNTTFVSRTKRY